jgi:predicted enzyme related to lactoylglutathione lyase
MTATATTIQAIARVGMTNGVTISVDVSDYKASKAFYQDILGFEMTYELLEYGWCEFRTATADVTIGLSKVEEVKVNGGMSPVFAVTDIEQTRSMLEAKGVRFDGPNRTLPGLVILATFYDPDGHTFMLAQSLTS